MCRCASVRVCMCAGVQACRCASVQQSCRQIEISPEFGSFSGAFLGVFNNNVKILCYLRIIRELFGSIFGQFFLKHRNSVLFLGAF